MIKGVTNNQLCFEVKLDRSQHRWFIDTNICKHLRYGSKSKNAKIRGVISVLYSRKVSRYLLRTHAFYRSLVEATWRYEIFSFNLRLILRYIWWVTSQMRKQYCIMIQFYIVRIHQTQNSLSFSKLCKYERRFLKREYEIRRFSKTHL